MLCFVVLPYGDPSGLESRRVTRAAFPSVRFVLRVSYSAHVGVSLLTCPMGNVREQGDANAQRLFILGEITMKRVLLRILIIFGILILTAATGVVADYLGVFAFFGNLPIVALIILLAWLFAKKT